MFGRDAREISASYGELAALADSGYPLIEGLEFFVRKSAKGTSTRTAATLVAVLRRGSTLHTAMKRLGYPRVDVAIMNAAEQTGRVPEAARLLAQYYGERAEMTQSLRAAMTKPGLLLLASFVLLDLPALAGGELTPNAYCLRALARVAVAGGVGLAALGALKSRGAALVRKVPVLGALAESIALESFFTCVRLGFRSGCDFGTVMSLAMDVADDPDLARAAREIGATAGRAGLAEAFERSRAFRPDQVQALRVGEATGKLDEAFARIGLELRSEVRARIAVLQEWLPRLIYGGAMIYAGWRILGFYSGYFKMLDQF